MPNFVEISPAQVAASRSEVKPLMIFHERKDYQNKLRYNPCLF
jgi:hypothetical protein